MPFLDLGISILFVKAPEKSVNLFAFLLPLSTNVWCLLILAGFAVSIVMYGIARYEKSEIGYIIKNSRCRFVLIFRFVSVFISYTHFWFWQTQSLRNWRIGHRRWWKERSCFWRRNTFCNISPLPLVYYSIMGATRLRFSPTVRLENISPRQMIFYYNIQRQNYQVVLNVYVKFILVRSHQGPWQVFGGSLP